TVVFEIQNGRASRRVLEPSEFGVAIAQPADLKGGDRDTNVAIARAILDGEKGPRRDIVLVNAAAALAIAGKATDFRAGVKMAAHSIDSGAAGKRLKKLVEFTRS
ncbi:MAG: anthranilate phosphoribosyltransferase, partial [Bryobacteraceae bacterium]